MKILAITTIRSDYDLMSGLYRELNDDQEIEFKLLVAGTHLSPTYGQSINEIEKDGLNILVKSETLLDSESHAGRLKSASLMLLSFIDQVDLYKPDLIIYAGDREDVMVGALLGAYLNIPTLHFFGGDHSPDGHVDNPIRHATSKLTTYHCPSIEYHAKRLRAIGEPNDRISVIGSIALDKFNKHKCMSIDEIQSSLLLPNIEDKKIALVIFHPIDSERKIAKNIVKNIISILLENNIFPFVSSPNSDPNNRSLLELHQEYKDRDDIYFYKNLPREIFLSIFKNASLIIGNSSAGVLEAGFIPIPAINVGERQVGRYSGENVIFSGTDYEEISNSFKLITSDSFKNKIATMENIFGDGHSVEKAVKIIKETDFKSILYKKEDPISLNKGPKNE